MWSLFGLLVISLFIGFVILLGLNYVKDRKGFDLAESIWQMVLRLFIGASVCFIIALASEYPWLIYILPAVLALTSNYWMAWLDKKVRK